MRNPLKTVTSLFNPTKRPTRRTSPDAVSAAQLTERLRTEREATR